MKRARNLLLVLVLAFGGAGCLKSDMTLSLREDGSGFLEIYCSVPSQTIEQMTRMLDLEKEIRAAAGDDARPVRTELQERIKAAFLNDTADGIRREIEEKYSRHGIIVEDLAVDMGRTGREIHVKMIFRDLKQAAETDLFRQYGFMLTRNESGNYTFKRPAIAPIPAPAPGGESGGDRESDVKQASLLRGFDVRLRISMPGRILKTNADRTFGHNAVWVYEFQRDASALRRLQTAEMSAVFDGTGLRLPEIGLR